MSKTFRGVPPAATPDTTFIRQKLREAMVLGMPDELAAKPTFIFEPNQIWDEQDREGTPFDFAVTNVPTTDTLKAPVTPICAYEFFSPLGRQGAFMTEVGEFNPTSVVFTMFESEFASVIDFDHATIGASDQNWFFRFWRPTYAITDLQVYQVHCQAEGTQ